MPSQKSIILKMLNVAGEQGVTNTELKKIALKFGSVIHLLHKDGYEIVIENLDKGVCKYILLNPDKNTIDKKDGIEVLEQFANTFQNGYITADNIENALVVNNLLFKRLKRRAS